MIKPFNIDEISITFDIEGLDICESKEDVKNLFVKKNPIQNVKIEEFNYFSPL